MNDRFRKSLSLRVCAVALSVMTLWPATGGARASARIAPAAVSDDPEELYRQREDLAHAARAAELWGLHANTDFEMAWKLSRICYWLGQHVAPDGRKRWLERGVTAGEDAVRLAPDRPEGHFWLAADMGGLAESFGLILAARYRGRIKSELERAASIDASWQGGSADAALGQWYANVPRLLGGSRERAEEHFRHALDFDAENTSALWFLGRFLAKNGRTREATEMLTRVLQAPAKAEWIPEDRECKRRATELLKTLGPGAAPDSSLSSITPHQP